MPMTLVKQVTLIRHAQSIFNATGLRERDPKITNTGVAQATKLSGHYSVVVCSTLARALQTLQASQITYDRLIMSDLCREVRDGNPVNLLQYESNEMLEESPMSVTQRIEQLKALLKTFPDESTICVVSHHDFIYRLTGLVLPNCGTTTLALNE